MQEQKPKRKIKVPKVVDGQEVMVEIEVGDSAGPVWGPNNAHTLLNSRLQRVDGPVKASGFAVYTYDVRLPNMLHGRFLRSPHAHARVTRLETARALAIPGVKAVVEVGRDLLYEGAPVAAVAAVTPEIAGDAIRAIDVAYEVLPHVVKADAAIASGAPKVFAADDANLESLNKQGDAARVAEALTSCDAVVEVECRTPLVHHACLETHGMVVDYTGGNEATVYASTQGTFTIPDDAAQELGLSQSAVTVLVEHMGGGFGSKFGIGIEGKLACQLAKQLRAPVKMMLTREEEFVMAGSRSGSWQKLKGGATKDGALVAIHAVQYRLGGLGDGSQAGQPYVYRTAVAENVYREMYALHTNEDATRAFRAPGHPQASFAMETLMEALAYKLNLDPIEIRKKNLPDPVYHRQLDRGAREIGWERRNRVAGGAPGPLKRGFGCAVGAWGGGGAPQCVVDVTIARDGAVVVAVGTQDLGTGTRTYTRAIVAEELGLGMDGVREQIGSSKLGAANPSGGSTTAPSLAPAVKDAAYKARTMMAERVAPLLGAQPAEVAFAKGTVSGGGKSIPWKQACAALPAAGIAARGEWKENLQTKGAHGACFAEVEVDVETGQVRPIKMVHVQDIGLPLNRLGLESQINGGMIQSLGMTLFEGRVMDANLGVMVNPRFTDYKLPGCLEMPELVPIIDDEDTREAVIGVGEPAIIPAVGALANAVYNACGVQIRDLPITPDKILMALMKEGKSA
jgi:xanthine dehydrogenase YagR molybdenum-binding subunit